MQGQKQGKRIAFSTRGARALQRKRKWLSCGAANSRRFKSSSLFSL